MRYIIGADGGGTATIVNVCTLEGELLYEWRLGSLNINGQSHAAAGETIGQMITQIKKAGLSLSDCEGICMGAAGISNEEASVLIRRSLKEAGMTAPVILVGDHETALAAAGDGSGAVLISGTGSICFGKNEQGQNVRAGGYGHIIDDAGSAYAIGRDLLKAVVRSIDGREKATLLKDAVFQSLSIEKIEELMTWLYDPERKKGEIAALAVLLENAAAAGDEAAARILNRSIQELFLLTRAVVSRLENCKMLVLGGSVLLKNRRIYEGLSELVKKEYPQITILKMTNHAADGAVRIIRRELSKHEKVSHR